MLVVLYEPLDYAYSGHGATALNYYKDFFPEALLYKLKFSLLERNLWNLTAAPKFAATVHCNMIIGTNYRG